MSRAGRIGLTLAAILAAGAGGYWAGHRDLALPDLSWCRLALNCKNTVVSSGLGILL